MTDELKTETLPIQPMKVAIVSGTGTGDGGNPITTGTTATTPDHHPNVVFTVVGPMMAILIRFINTFLTTLLGLVTASPVMKDMGLIQAGDFYDLLIKCAAVSIAPAGVGLIKDVVTIFGKLENKYPLLTGNI